MMSAGVLTSQGSIVEVLDKGKGAVVVMDGESTIPRPYLPHTGTVETKDSTGQVLFKNQFSSFIRGIGGFGGASNSPVVKEGAPIPDGAPCAKETEKTHTNQAAVYRLTGDANPLHIDPAMASIGGFDKPILHGLCSFGYATRHVLRKFGDNNPANVKAIKVRFASPVYPGETLETSMWQRGSRVHFQSRVVERNVIVLNNCYVDLANLAPAPAAQAAPSTGLKVGFVVFFVSI